jgi:hypothetical protein
MGAKLNAQPEIVRLRECSDFRVLGERSLSMSGARSHPQGLNDDAWSFLRAAP